MRQFACSMAVLAIMGVAGFGRADVAMRNDAHGLAMRFGPDGVLVRPAAGGDWEWGLALRSGLGAQAPTGLTRNGDRVEFARGDLVEWYVNDERGLEQGFTLIRRPAGSDGRLVFEMDVRGNLAGAMAGGEFEFRTDSGEVAMRYGGLKAWDAAGRVLPSRMTLAGPAGAQTIALEIDAAGAEYPVVVDPIAGNPRWTAYGGMRARNSDFRQPALAT